MGGQQINNKPGMTLILDNKAIDEMLRGPNGPVVRYMMMKADRLQTAAKEQCHVGKGQSERGHLRDSIVKRITSSEGTGSMPVILVGSDHPIALIHHEGTRPHMIYPRSANVLAWEDAGAVGGMRFAAFVHHPGTQPNRYLTDNLHLIQE